MGWGAWCTADSRHATQFISNKLYVQGIYKQAELRSIIMRGRAPTFYPRGGGSINACCTTLNRMSGLACDNARAKKKGREFFGRLDPPTFATLATPLPPATISVLLFAVRRTKHCVYIDFRFMIVKISRLCIRVLTRQSSHAFSRSQRDLQHRVRPHWTEQHRVVCVEKKEN